MNANQILILENGVEHYIYNLDQVDNITPLINMSPQIHFIEQPVEYYRFRYASEEGAHGSLLGRNSKQNSSKEKSYPKFKIQNYNGQVLIKVKLCAKLPDNEYFEHVHKLKGSPNCKDDGTYEKTENINDNSVIELDQLYIEMVTKKDIKKTMEQRHRNFSKEKLSKYIKHLETHNNVVYLGIEAYLPGFTGPICSGFSELINNLKGSNTNKLHITRRSRSAGTAKGGDEMFILCEKVEKKDIKVRFFKDNWEAYGTFAEVDVHHQFAIVLKTPPYEIKEIEETVTVQMELIKPSTNEKSAPLNFDYHPDPNDDSIRRKRKRRNVPFNDSERTERDLGLNPSGVSGASAEASGGSKFAKRKPDNLRVKTECKMDASMEEAPNTSEGEAPNTSEVIEFVDSKFANMQIPQAGTSFNAMSQSSCDPMLTSAVFPLEEPELPEELKEVNPISNIDIELRELIDSIYADGIVPDSVPCETARTKAKGIQKLVKRGVSYEGSSSDKETIDSKPIKVDPDESKVRDLLKRDPVTGYKLLYQLAEQTYIALQKYAKTSLVKFLLDTMGHLMVIPDENGDNAIHNAVIHADNKSTALFNLVAVAEQLPAKLDCLNMLNNKIQTPLHLAVHVDSPSMVKALIEHGADSNLTDRHGNSALHLACLHGKYDIVHILLNAENYSKKYEENMPSLKSFNYDGYAPIHLAVRSQSLECVKEVCVAGADVNETELTNGKTAIHMAVELRNVEILKELLKHDYVDVNIQAFNGCSSLHLACSLGETQIVELLMDAKADPYIENLDNSQHDESSDDETDENLKNINYEEIHGYNSFDLARNNTKILEILTGKNFSGTKVKFEVEERINPSEEHKNNKCFNHLNDSAIDDLQDPISQSKLSDTYNDLCSEFSNKVNLHSDENTKINENMDSGVLTSHSDISPVDSGIVLSDTESMDVETKMKLASLLDPSEDWKKVAENSDLDYLCSMIENTSSPTLSLLPHLQDVKQLRKVLENLKLHEAVEVVDDYLKEK